MRLLSGLVFVGSAWLPAYPAWRRPSDLWGVANYLVEGRRSIGALKRSVFARRSSRAEDVLPFYSRQFH